MAEVLISRYKLHATPGKNVRFAWKWHYVVKVPGKPDSDRGPGLASAESWARSEARVTGLPVRKEW